MLRKFFTLLGLIWVISKVRDMFVKNDEETGA
jgi:hypothetical protein